MADPGLDRTRRHVDVLQRLQAGTLTVVERAAVATVLDRALIATLLDEEDAAVGARPGLGPPPSRWTHVADAYRALLDVEAPAARVGGAEVHRLHARRADA